MYSFETKLIKAGKNRDGKVRYNIYLNRESIIKLNAKPKMPVRIIIEPIIENINKEEQNGTKEETKDDSEGANPKTDCSLENRERFRDNQKTEQLPYLSP